ncbi:hypothetical protein [Paenibacillus radicis (ex Xue et al. 2023)]|uniref:Uncharacterized protein n=1 Tax=Paenibacillus radicis (ex Xue et al. 2023) TaxID=2972489 RepID=A0ABT1YHA5_9BACL|nr:hypothetical protein [Paenibacillus radicis (ex Xue et al. 2023)]MCR8632575.1 hypothetical protein [Paenibacillus radicis (ex Xue et al. 2023)]
MKEKALIGYNHRKAERYFASLEAEEATLNQQREINKQSYKLKEAELLYEINNIKQKIVELNQLETSLKQWIQRNEN